VVVIGASAGGLQALVEIFEGLPKQLRASVFVVVHTGAESTSYLPEILSRTSSLPVSLAAHQARIQPGHIYIAPPDMHLLLGSGVMRLSHGPKENGFRPAVDPLFRSAARAYGSSTLGVILSGALDDGTYGLQVIKELGGTAVVQDPEEATHPGMILSALQHVDVDQVLKSGEIGAYVARCCGTMEVAAGGEGVMARQRDPDPQNAIEETDVEEMEKDFGPPSGLTCPDCGGALWELKNGKVTRYRCHVGHQYTTEGLDNGHREVVEGALWKAVRVLEEQADLRKRIAQRAEQGGMKVVASGFADSAHDAQRQAHTIRELLLGGPVPARATGEAPRRPRKPPRKKAR